MDIGSSSGYVVIEGNIGAGKSTFLSILKKQLDLDILYEPTHAWQNVGGHNILDAFYKDAPRWAYTFQTYAFITRIMAQQERMKEAQGPLIVERSVYADRFCFAKNAHEMGVMSALEWQMYTQWFKWLMDVYIEKPKGFIYLQTSPQTCYERLRNRNRSEEKGVGKEYLELLHEKHEAWLIRKEDIIDGLQDIPVLVLACDAEFEKDEQVQNQHREKVAAFLAQYCK